MGFVASLQRHADLSGRSELVQSKMGACRVEEHDRERRNHLRDCGCRSAVVCEVNGSTARSVATVVLACHSRAIFGRVGGVDHFQIDYPDRLWSCHGCTAVRICIRTSLRTVRSAMLR